MKRFILQNLHHIELDREIDNEADDKSALTHEVRQQREAVVLGDLLAVERDESAHWSGRRWHRILPVEQGNDINPVAPAWRPARHRTAREPIAGNDTGA